MQLYATVHCNRQIKRKTAETPDAFYLLLFVFMMLKGSNSNKTKWSNKYCNQPKQKPLIKRNQLERWVRSPGYISSELKVTAQDYLLISSLIMTHAVSGQKPSVCRRLTKTSRLAVCDTEKILEYNETQDIMEKTLTWKDRGMWIESSCTNSSLYLFKDAFRLIQRLWRCFNLFIFVCLFVAAPTLVHSLFYPQQQGPVLEKSKFVWILYIFFFWHVSGVCNEGFYRQLKKLNSQWTGLFEV